jgi:hypothetical protein
MSERPGIFENSISNMLASPRGKAIRVWLLAAFLTGLTIIVHFTSPSTLNHSEESWGLKLDLHSSADVFRVRPLTTGIVQFLNEEIGLPVKTAFFGLQFLLFFLMCPALYFFFRQLGYDDKYSTTGMIIFALSLPVFLAHFEPVFTWSDFWLYLMVPLSLGLAIRGKIILAAATMACAMVARETAVLFIPILFGIIYRQENGGIGKSLLVSFLTLALFLGGRVLFVGFYFPDPEYGFQFNFDGVLRTIDSVFSLIVSLGFIWVVGIYQVIQKSDKSNQYDDLIRFGAVLTAIGFIVTTHIYGHFRESRLFQPPAILLVPLVLSYLKMRGDYIKDLFHKYNQWFVYSFLIVLLTLSILAAKLLFPEFEYRAWRDGNWIYLGLHISLTVLFLIIEISRKRFSIKNM